MSTSVGSIARVAGYGEDRRVNLVPLRRRLLVLITLLGTVLLAVPAAAEPPSSLEERITDSADVLDEGQVEAAIEELESETPLDLFVVYVDSFDGMATTEWVSETAAASNLGANDVLLAVAVEDRAFDVGMQGSAELSQSDVQQVINSEVEPALANNDWTGAAVAMAAGLQDAYGGLGGGAADDSGGGSFLGGLGTLFLIGLVVILGFGVFSAFRSKSSDGPREPGTRQLPKGHPLTLPTEELEKRAGSALVGADDAIRSSEEELSFAKAQFGLQATDEFTAVLEQAKEKAARAFSLRQQLDDDQPETEPQRRQMLAEIVTLTQQVDTELDAQAERFAELRNMQARAPEVLDELEQRAREVGRQIEAAR
ncbi:TPM domain-containing protein, partial [Georgenia sp. 10Sc9-8]|nr:TPM domain-containing protein [Georgenia halotolerans]